MSPSAANSDERLGRGNTVTGPERQRPLAALRPHPQAGLIPVMPADEYEALRADIRRRGLLAPLEATPAGVLLDGRARLKAATELGLETIPVRSCRPADQLEHMLLAALRRQHLNESQRAALALQLADVQETARRACQRKLANLKGQGADVAALPPRGERTRDYAARIAGICPRTVQDTATVRAADAELFAAIQRGEIRASAAARQVRRARRDAQLSCPLPLPGGRFELIYADPPWQLGNPDGAKAPENHYPTMPLQEIKALQVPAAEDAILFLWAVNSHLLEAIGVVQAWGFEYVSNSVWVKPSIGLGNWTRNRHELLLWGRRGRYPTPEPQDRPDSVIQARRGRHSEKPRIVYDQLERAYPQASKLELFARQGRAGWAAWGNEAPQ